MLNASHDIHSEIARIKAKGQEAALVTIIGASGSTPSGVGSKMLVKADGNTMGTIGGGSIERLVTEEALRVMRMGRAKRLNFSLREGEECGMICGGDVEVFIEPILQEPKLFIFGGGHIALSLSKMAKLVGFRIVVIDDRPDYASPQRFPEAEATMATDYAQAFSNIEIDNMSYIVILTHGHEGDEIVLERALKTEAKYIGMIGSRRKNRVIFNHLLSKGIPQDRIDKVHAPIGLEIHSSTSEEIAVSILAEIIKVRRTPPTEEGKR